MFSFLLSFMIDLYNLNPLTANPNKHGINIIFCNNIADNINNMFFVVSNDIIIDAIVYPRQNPLKQIIKYTNIIPITVEPVIHNNKLNPTFSFMEVLSNSK